MGIVTSTFTTYDASAINREDLIDVITNIDPTDAWFTSNTPNGKAKARYHEWLKDSLATPTANKTIEGDQYSATAITQPTRLGNYTQILRKTWSITDTEEEVDKAGMKSALSYYQTKNLKELARDIEYAMLINSAASAGATGTARQMKGVLGWVTTNVVTGTGTGDEVLTESMVNDALQKIWENGEKPSNLLCGGFQKRKISAFTSNTRYSVADEKKLTYAVDVYQSDFGTVAVRLSTIMNSAAAGYVLAFGNMSLWQKAWLRPVKVTESAKIAASTMKVAEAELTLECRAEDGSAKISQLTTS